MPVDQTTPAVVALLSTHPDEAFTAAEIAEKAGLNPGTVSGWFVKKLDTVQVSMRTVDGTRRYQWDPDKVVVEKPKQQRRRRNQATIDKAKKAQTAPRRKAGAIYAELIWREGELCVLVLPNGEIVKGVVV